MTSSPLLNALCSVILSTHCNVILRCAGDYLLNLKQTCTREQELVGSQVKTWFSHIKAKFYFFIKMFYLFIYFFINASQSLQCRAVNYTMLKKIVLHSKQSQKHSYITALLNLSAK